MLSSIPFPYSVFQVVYAYPNEYTVGITSLGYQLVWAYFETHPFVSVSRLFTDVGDSIPASPDLVGFSFAWELDYSNLLTLLEQMDIPILSSDRDDSHPLVFGGGPVLTANPEPYADFFDVVLLGDGEEMLGNFTNRMIDVREQLGPGRPPREELLAALAAIPGVYIPQFYVPKYSGGPLGDFAGMEVVNPAAPAVVEKQTYRGGTLAASTVVSPLMAWENIFMAEVVRSCPEMCRFCMASYLTLPFRHAPLEGSLIPTIERGLEVTDRLGLLGASVTQHPEFDDLLKWLMRPERDHVRLSIASVRTNTVTPELTAALSARGTKSLTVAVESGSPAVRQIINKKLEQDDIVRAAIVAQEGGLQGLKLYGMVGVPGEEESDVDATIEMMLTLKKAAPRLRLTLGCSTFVPKAHTPFQWYGVRSAAEKRLKRVEKALAKEGIAFRPESYKWSLQQAVLSRGDRRLTAALLAGRGMGDSLGTFRRAAKEVSDVVPPLEYYAERDYDPEVPLPWSHLQGPLGVSTLRKHLLDAQQHMVRGEVKLESVVDS